MTHTELSNEARNLVDQKLYRTAAGWFISAAEAAEKVNLWATGREYRRQAGYAEEKAKVRRGEELH